MDSNEEFYKIKGNYVFFMLFMKEGQWMNLLIILLLAGLMGSGFVLWANKRNRPFRKVLFLLFAHNRRSFNLVKNIVNDIIFILKRFVGTKMSKRIIGKYKI